MTALKNFPLKCAALGCVALMFMGAFLMAPTDKACAATLMEGCNTNVWNAMRAKADAEVAYDVGVTQEIIRKPDSVLEMTCFGRAAMHTGATAGVFSGGFSGSVSTVISGAYDNFVNNNFRATTASLLGPIGLDGAYGNSVGSARPSRFSSSYSCNVMQNVWDDIMGAGIVDRTPYATFADLMSASLVGDGPNLAATLIEENNPGGAIDRLNSAMTSLPTTSIPSFVGDDSLCAVLVSAGVTVTCP